MTDLSTDLVVRPRVLVVGGVPLTTSLAVAEHFEKVHKNVLREIREIIEQQDDPAFSSGHFQPFSHVSSRGKLIPCYRLSELGFSLLVMGFTGERAGRWKRAYAQTFQAMREHILQRERDAHTAVVAKQAELDLKNAHLMGDNINLRGSNDKLRQQNMELGARVQALAMEKYLADQILTDGYSSNVAMQALVEFKELFADWVAEDYREKRLAFERHEAVAAIKSRVDPRRAAAHEMLIRLQFALNRNLTDACVCWAMLQLGSMLETVMRPRYPGTNAIDIDPVRPTSATRRQILQRIQDQISPVTLAESLRRLVAMDVVEIQPTHPSDDRRLKRYRLKLATLFARIVDTAERSRWVNDHDGVRGQHKGVDMFLPLDINGQRKPEFPLHSVLQPRIDPVVLPVRLQIEVIGPQDAPAKPADEEPTFH